MSQEIDDIPARIIGIQFSVLSPDEIERTSVVEILTRDTYVNNNKPVINGLFDPRMGTLEYNQICPTDGHDYYKCPGYIGHIRLARPVFFIQFFNTVMRILKCICIKCSKVLVDKNKYKHLLNMRPEERWIEVSTAATKIKRCGEDTIDGCSCKQPTKIKKVDLATIIAEWDNDSEDSTKKHTLTLTADIVTKLFRRISNEDVHFMGFSPVWCRPEWMICQVLPVPPPSMRPSVKQDGQSARGEDDMTHILVNICKANTTLEEKIRQNASSSVINDATALLQYFIAAQIDNRMPGGAQMSQRSGRALKSIKDRITGKTGRIRQNLMGKRVDYSARSVITPEPNISIAEIGVPIQIATKLTRPVVVNHHNKAELMKMVRNGPNVYPGARILFKKNGKHSISLGYIDANSIDLDIGDVVHRHMLDGDYILFNRQPTVHRMSMMAHKVKIMPCGDSFRMNVGVTKPYNADFDGDEMNMHMPQDDVSEIELRELASIPNHIISPGNSKPIIGMEQDSLLGMSRFTRPDIKIDVKEAMNMLINVPNLDLSIFTEAYVSNNTILTQIMPPISLNYKGDMYKKFKRDISDPDYADKHGKIVVRAGTFIQGQLQKSSIGSAGNGLIHRTYIDCGKNVCVSFIDMMQRISNEYMKRSGYSVGISDLIWKRGIKEKVNTIIQEKHKEVEYIIHQTHLGIFENDIGDTMRQALENKITNLLNETVETAGSVTQQSLNLDNRFVFMGEYLSGSKGSVVNISQMIACVGQQVVSNNRIRYGFNNRCLPHFKQFDDSPSARGFVTNSFINGLTPTEAFFHAIAGRVGLIDTAVRTSDTGYIQRRLIKAMEDIMVYFDMTVRNHKRKILQFNYSGDNFDTTALDKEYLTFMHMKVHELYAYFHFPVKFDSAMSAKFTKEALKHHNSNEFATKIQIDLDYVLERRHIIGTNVMQGYMNDDKVSSPINFKHCIRFIAGQANLSPNSIIDISPIEVFEMVHECYNNIISNYFIQKNELFRVLFFFNLTPKVLLLEYHFNRETLRVLLDYITMRYYKSIIHPGEMIGIVCAQSVGEPTTQATLNTFHNAGVASRSNVTTGLTRISELLNLTVNVSKPAMTVYIKRHEEHDIDTAIKIMNDLTYVTLAQLISSITILYDPHDTRVDEDTLLLQQYRDFEKNICNIETQTRNPWLVRMKLDSMKMADYYVTMDDVYYTIMEGYREYVDCVFSDYNDDNCVFRLRINTVLLRGKKKSKPNTLDITDDIYLLKQFQDTLMYSTVIKGIKDIKNVTPRVIQDSIDFVDGDPQSKKIWVLDTQGANLIGVLALSNIDTTRTVSWNVHEVQKVLGIEAARLILMHELRSAYDASVPIHQHISLLVDRMTCNHNLVAISRHGTNNDNIDVIAKATFEETPEMLTKASKHGELDHMRGISANLMCGQEGYYGTNLSQMLLDVEEMNIVSIKDDKVKTIEEQFNLTQSDIPHICSNAMLQMNIPSSKSKHIQEDHDYEIDL